MTSPHHPLAEQLNRTVALEVQEVPPVDSGPDQAGDSDASLPKLPRHAITTRALTDPSSRDHPSDPLVPRHEVGSPLGIGASGEVYSVFDHNLQRTVAMKIVPAASATDQPSRTQLISEARMTASLAHPNVLPVYDLDVDQAGRAYFSMKQVEGQSLGSVLEQSTPTRRHELIATGSRIVNLFIGVSQAMAYAHGQQVVHQDIKPDNIMLGQYGEILVVDWGSACRLTPGIKPNLYGTPLYMSPEQARLETVDARSDVYCIGATLLHVLLLRPPCWCDDLDRFWQRKKRGTLDPITPQESRQVPTELLSIALKALSCDPDDRYLDGAALLKDLKLYQAGLPVSAHHDSMLESAVRWYRSYRKPFWTTLLVALVVGGLLLFIYTELVKEVASWGRPVLVEDFADDSWRRRWAVNQGDFEHKGQGITSTGYFLNRIVFTRKFVGATAIEYDADELEGNPPGDMSADWYSDVQFSADKTKVISWKYHHLLQFGAFYGGFSQITSSEADEQPLAYSPVHPQYHRSYHVRAQIADDRLMLFVDGKLVCSWTEPFRFNSGYIGISCFYPGKQISNLRIYSREMAQKVVATAVGDAFVQHGDIDEAATQYARVAAAYPGHALGREAIYKQGLCESLSGRYDNAVEIWKPLRGSSYDFAIALQDIDHQFALGQHHRALQSIVDLNHGLSIDQRHLLANQWAKLLAKVDLSPAPGEQLEWLKVHDQLFTDETTEDAITATTLFRIGHFQEVLDRFPHLRSPLASAHLALGHFQLLLHDFHDQFYEHDMAAYLTGHPELIDDRFEPTLHRQALLNAGRVLDLLRDYPTSALVAPRALAFQGRCAEAIAIPGIDPLTRAMILCNAGRSAEVEPGFEPMVSLAKGESHPLAGTSNINWVRETTRDLLVLNEWIAHPQPSLLAKFKTGYQHPSISAGLRFILQSSLSFDAFGVAFLASLDDPQSFERSCREIKAHFPELYQQQFLYDARYLLGEIDDAAYLAQPWGLYAPARMRLLQGLKADHLGQREPAITAYQSWLAIPAWQRDEFPNPLWIRLVTWRLQRLTIPAGGH